MVTSPAASVSTVFERVPLRMLPAPPAGAWCFACPRWSVSSSSSALSSTVAVIDFNNPSGPVMSSPRPRAARTSSCTAARSAALTLAERSFFGSFIELMLGIVSATTGQPSSPTTSACRARNTVQRTVPILKSPYTPAVDSVFPAGSRPTALGVAALEADHPRSSTGQQHVREDECDLAVWCRYQFLHRK